jgi:alpha-beta hydrolase superfamily lysophospholipase
MSPSEHAAVRRGVERGAPLLSSIRLALFLVAIGAIVVALVRLRATTEGLRIERTWVGSTPVTIFHPSGAPLGPVVLIAHGFAGSQQLMQPFATTFAQNGYIAVTFDLPGHGRSGVPLTGDITRVEGATQTLVASLKEVEARVRPEGDGRLAVLGHSMATDVVVRFAEGVEPGHPVAATIAVSMFSPAVTADAPRNLLVIVGEHEGTLRREALRAIGLATAPEAPRASVTYGDLALGTGRRAAWSASAEHVSVLYSRASMREALAWLDATFGVERTVAPYLDARGGWILLLLGGVVLLARSVAGALPVVTRPARGAGLELRAFALPLLLPAVATPLALRVIPTHVLPVLVGDYLAFHFALYGLLTYGCLRWVGPRRPASSPVPRGRLAFAAAVMALYVVVVFGGAMDTYVTSFAPSLARAPLILAMLAGTLSFSLADEWVARGPGAPRGAYAATKCAFLLSLGIAVALDVQRLFFLVLIVPVILVFFVLFGAMSRWAYRRTGHPFVGAVASAIGFAWSIGVTFPMIAG